ncbi:hypothetical protein NC651_028621 [Populus alba x Populus x berolinensis]|nr:hypothetical protein NC651_028621 [Populus alba x Populus x berolinensis]
MMTERDPCMSTPSLFSFFCRHTYKGKRTLPSWDRMMRSIDEFQGILLM